MGRKNFITTSLLRNEDNTRDKLISKLAISAMLFFLFVIIYSLSLLFKSNISHVYILVLSMSLFSFFGVVYFLFGVNTKSSISSSKSICLEYGKTLQIVLYIIFVMSILFIFVILDNTLYVKPTSYYLLVSLAAVSIGLQIGFKKEFCERDVLITFLEIFLLALIIRSSSLFLTPFHVGIDTHRFHFPMILDILETGHLDRKAFIYYYYPSYHLIQSITGLIIGFSINSFKIVHLFNSLVLIPIAYLLGTHLRDKRAGLICALLFSLSTMNIFIVLFSTSKIGGVTLLFLDLFFLLKMMKSPSIKFLFMFFTCSLSLFLWHPELDAALMFILSSYFFIKVLYRRDLKSDTLFLLYSVFYIAYNIYVSVFIFGKVVQGIFSTSINANDSHLIREVLVNSGSFDFLSQTFISYLGLSLPFFFVSYSFFSWIKERDSKTQFLMLSFLITCFIPIIGFFTSNYGLDPIRLLTYISLISLIISSCSIFVIFNFRSKTNIAIFTLFIFIFSLFSVSSYFAADGSELFNDKIPVGVIYTTHANKAVNTFIDSKLPYDVVITTDPTTIQVSDLHRKTIKSYDLNSTGYILINDYHIRRLNLGLDGLSTTSNKNKIYSNYFNVIKVPSD